MEIFNYREFKKKLLEAMEIDASGELVGNNIGTRENPIPINPHEYMMLNEPEFIGQTRQDKEGNYSIVWYSEGTYYISHLNIFS